MTTQRPTLNVGDTYSFTKQVDALMIETFATLSGDTNPLHLDDKVGEGSVFGQRVAHGMISASFISTVIGTRIGIEGVIYLGQDLQFKHPVFVNDVLTAVVEVVSIDNRKVKLDTKVYNQHYEVVTCGTAKILLPN